VSKLKRRALSTIITHLILIGIIMGAMSSIVTLINYATNNVLFNSQQFESFIIENVEFKTDERGTIEVTVRNIGSIDVVIDKVLINDNDVSSEMAPNKLYLKPKESGAIAVQYDWIPNFDHSITIISERFNIARDFHHSPE